MSDPVSNSEIEDVLASIRRLVSENAKALKRDNERDPEAEKLVLTPAFRIDESEAQPQVADVFAVDTETWNDAGGRAEDPENAGIFADEVSAEVEADGAAPEAEDVPLVAPSGAVEFVHRAAVDSTPPQDAGGAAETVEEVTAAGPEAAAQAHGDAESVTPDAGGESPTETALEQRIAELEAAVDLSAHDAEPDAGSDADAVDEATRQGEATEPVPFREASEAVGMASSDDSAAAETEAPAMARAEEPTDATDTGTAEVDEAGVDIEAKASDAPPRSWIEGLVVAAAAAEATRLAERAQAASGTQVAAEDATAGDAEAEESETATVDGQDNEVLPVDADETVDETMGAGETDADEPVEDAAEEPLRETFELTEAHAAAAEEDSAVEDDTTAREEPVADDPDMLPRFDPLPEETDAAEAAADNDVAAGEADAPDARSDAVGEPETDLDEAAAEPMEPEPEEPEQADATEPERSWVDRLIAAAATLRGTPADSGAAEDATGEDQPATAEDGETTERETDAGEVDAAADEADVEDLKGASDTSLYSDADADVVVAATGEAAAETGLETLSLDDPLEPDADADAEAEPETVAEDTVAATDDAEPVDSAMDASAEDGTDNASLEWEPVDAPDSEAIADNAPIVDSETVLTGPWTARDALAGTPDTDTVVPEVAQGEPPEPEEEGAQGAETVTDDVPVGSLEWEPVDHPLEDLGTQPETTSPASEPVGAFAAATVDAQTEEPGDTEGDEPAAAVEGDTALSEETDVNVEYDSKVGSEDIDFQDESEQMPDAIEEELAVETDTGDALAPEHSADADAETGDEPEESAEDTAADHAPEVEEEAALDLPEDTAAPMDDTSEQEASFETLDEDAAAVAAAAEVDWEDSGMAAAGVAMGGVATLAGIADDSGEPDIGTDGTGVSPQDDEAVIDEAMLRELVGQLVRDELQGTVGERITHNVRRLIRREIARALTLQDFEK